MNTLAERWNNNNLEEENSAICQNSHTKILLNQKFKQ